MKQITRTFISISSSRSTLISLPFSSLLFSSWASFNAAALFVARSPAIRLFCCFYKNIKKKEKIIFLTRFWSQLILTARIFFKQPCNQVLIVCLATSSSIIYSNSSRASNSSNWSAFLMSTERYDNILKYSSI